jgi:GPI mannosyltransferase 3
MMMEHGPLRSYASIVPTICYYHVIRKYFLLRYHWDTATTAWMVSRGPLLLNAMIVAAPVDWMVWYMSRWMTIYDDDDEDDIPPGNNKNNKKVWWVNFCLYCTLTSWFHAYALVRTYSNSLETLLVAVSVALVSSELLSESNHDDDDDDDNNGNNSNSRARARACLAFFLGGICSAIRFTCLTVYVPMGLILSCRKRSSKVVDMVAYLLGVCAIFGAMGLLVTLLLDRIMYGFWAFPVLANFHFNVVQGNGSLYGTHPVYWYFVAGIPALVGMLLPVLVYDLSRVGSWNYARRNLWIICGSCIIAHSASAHKEFRFLLPILPLFCLIAGSRLEQLIRKSTTTTTTTVRLPVFFLLLGAILNLVPVLYLGLVHQRAPIDVNRAILNEVALHHHRNDSLSSSVVVVNVHYLMGCHSTPLMSHLHAPPTRFLTWHLDCGPSCRADPAVDCESDAFAKNPRAFLEQALERYYYYNYSVENNNNDVDQSCTADWETAAAAAACSMPDFVVCHAENLSELRPLLENTMHMREIGRFIHEINGIQMGDFLQIGAANLQNNDFSQWNFLQGFVKVSLEEMVLYTRRTENPFNMSTSQQI